MRSASTALSIRALAQPEKYLFKVWKICLFFSLEDRLPVRIAQCFFPSPVFCGISIFVECTLSLFTPSNVRFLYFMYGLGGLLGLPSPILPLKLGVRFI